MGSEYPDGLPVVASSSVEGYVDGEQDALAVTGYGTLYQPRFLQQSLSETGDHHTTCGPMLQDQSFASTHNLSRGFLPFLSPHTRAGARSPDAVDDSEQCCSRASFKPFASTTAFDSGISQYTSRQSWLSVDALQRSPWTQSPELGEPYRHHSHPLELAPGDIRFPPAAAMSNPHALNFSDGGYRSSTSYPSYIEPCCDGLPSVLDLSPQSSSQLPDDGSLSRDHTAPLSDYGADPDSNDGLQAPALSSEASVPSLKEQEPYAQLIYKAFMSQPRHAMTLQEIYQWFRDNTDKAKNPGKGWQNSIRHNLSMNRAFQKKDKKFGETAEEGQAVEASASGDNKKTSEWYLSDWAVKGGVQSTTRYRKENSSSRRAGGPGRQPSYANKTRRSAGRQVARAANRTKESGRRKQLPQEAPRTSVPAGLAITLPGGSGAFGTFPALPLDQNRYASRQSTMGEGDAQQGPEYAPFSALDAATLRHTPTVKSEDEAVTPEAEDLLTLHRSQNNYAYGAPPPVYSQMPYTYEDVAGVYTGSPSSNGRVPPLFMDQEEAPKGLSLLSEYSSAAYAWTNSNMGSSQFNF